MGVHYWHYVPSCAPLPTPSGIKRRDDIKKIELNMYKKPKAIDKLIYLINLLLHNNTLYKISDVQIYKKVHKMFQKCVSTIHCFATNSLHNIIL